MLRGVYASILYEMKYEDLKSCAISNNLYRPQRPHAGLRDVLANVLAVHMLVSVCLLGTALRET